VSSQVPTDSLALLAEEFGEFVEERNWNRFHTPGNLAVALVVEASELLECFQWCIADSETVVKEDERCEHIRGEMADVALYLLALARTLDVDLAEACREKIAVNRRRWPVGKSANGEWIRRTRTTAPV
jgi:NTP pyrophosphatase (non-canonical NTP hydrolase)